MSGRVNNQKSDDPKSTIGESGAGLDPQMIEDDFEFEETFLECLDIIQSIMAIVSERKKAMNEVTRVAIETLKQTAVIAAHGPVRVVEMSPKSKNIVRPKKKKRVFEGPTNY